LNNNRANNNRNGYYKARQGITTVRIITAGATIAAATAKYNKV
jgi:hypothetical protein